MELADFDYPLPAGAIAQTPASTRDASRLLVIDRATGSFRDQCFAEIPDLLRAGDCVVVNDSRVIPARVIARDPSDRPVELLFIQPAGAAWSALVRPGRRCRTGTPLTVPSRAASQARPGADTASDPDAGERATAEPCARLRVVDVKPDGTRLIERLDGTIDDLLAAHGMTPLPPYIDRHRKPDTDDAQRYQTVYARVPGSVAAPTAGLHFSEGVLARLRARDIGVHPITLHVGPATFRPIRASDIDAHVLPPERFSIPESTAAAVRRARAEGRRVVAVGTTVTRTLEGVGAREGRVAACSGEVDLYIRPGHRFRVVEALVTNFHLPRTSLLVLVAAFAGRELILRAYRHAVAAGYRFYSYGDATLIA